jgi:hypothetical protein
MADELILVEKDGEQIRIHPDALADHQRLGWVVAIVVWTKLEVAEQIASGGKPGKRK